LKENELKQNHFFRELTSGIQTLLLHKLRSFLTMLGVVFGVGSVVAMLAVGEGASMEALEQIRKLGSNNIIISSVKSVEEETSSTTRSFISLYGLTYQDHERIQESFSTVKKDVPVKLMRKASRLGKRSLELRVVGTSPQWFEVIPRTLLGGRRLTQTDMEKKSAVVVLTEFGARKLLAGMNTIGQSIRIGGDSFEVVGIMDRINNANVDGAAVVHIDDLQDVLGTTTYQLVYVVPEDVRAVESVADNIMNMDDRFCKLQVTEMSLAFSN